MKLIVILLSFILLTSGTNVNVKQYREIKLYERSGMLFLRTTINGHRTKLLLDTGASHSILDINQAEEFEFSYLNVELTERRYVGLGGVQEMYIVFDYIMKGNHISFLGADLGEVAEYMSKDGIKMVGIIGGDFLNEHDAIIDFKKRKLYLDINVDISVD